MTEVARRYGVARQTVHEWLARYAGGGLGGLADRSSRPASCPHQMPAQVEAPAAWMFSPAWSGLAEQGIGRICDDLASSLRVPEPCHRL